MTPLIHNLLPLVLFCLLPLTAAAVTPNAVAVDSGSGEPLPAASVFDRKGNILGICSDKGVLPYASPDAYPLTVRYIGYLPALVESPSQQRVEMHPVDYSLPELTVEPGKRVVLHLTAYVREYSTLTTYTDTVFLFREKTVDFMVPTRKAGKYRGWTQPRLLASRSYYRFAGADGNDSVSNTFGQHFSWSDWIGIPPRVDLPKALHKPPPTPFSGAIPRHVSGAATATTSLSTSTCSPTPPAAAGYPRSSPATSAMWNSPTSASITPSTTPAVTPHRSTTFRP